MNAYLIPSLLGLLTGLLLHWGQFSRAEGLRHALGLRRSLTLRTGLTALGWGVLLTSLLMWLAVIDVDRVDVLPLSLGTLPTMPSVLSRETRRLSPMTKMQPGST